MKCSNSWNINVQTRESVNHEWLIEIDVSNATFYISLSTLMTFVLIDIISTLGTCNKIYIASFLSY